MLQNQLGLLNHQRDGELNYPCLVAIDPFMSMTVLNFREEWLESDESVPNTLAFSAVQRQRDSSLELAAAPFVLETGDGVQTMGQLQRSSHTKQPSRCGTRYARIGMGKKGEYDTRLAWRCIRHTDPTTCTTARKVCSASCGHLAVMLLLPVIRSPYCRKHVHSCMVAAAAVYLH